MTIYLKLWPNVQCCVVRGDKNIAVVKWLGSKPIHVAPIDAAVQSLGTCRSWSRQNENYIEAPQPVAIKNYNKYMGGIDLLDRFIGKYPMRGRTGKWTIRTKFHFFGLAAAAGWLQYKMMLQNLDAREKI
ncbi:unnamed protein product [Euphydryas editha]|uniref:PiggyBac transposable element-derived protein domain-containing protein n=1 Tax=Euphydryas editha TaxID=104508 RepID=A0AAU9VER7_EUPED|nr:unnamed protein product [Euphydryas editha]